MRKIALVVVSLVGAHGAYSSPGLKAIDAYSSSKSSVEVDLSSERATTQGTVKPLRALAMLLLAYNPPSNALNPAAGRFRPPVRPLADAGLYMSAPMVSRPAVSKANSHLYRNDNRLLDSPPSPRDVLKRPLDPSPGGVLRRGPLDDPDPYARQENQERQKKMSEFRLNVGEAIDNLNTDIPLILKEEPNWGIYTDDLELDATAVDQVAFGLIGSVAGLGARKVNGLQGNQAALRRLQKFRKQYVKHDYVRLKTRITPGSLTDVDGDRTIECRWTATLVMKTNLELVPNWAASVWKQFTGSDQEEIQGKEIIIDGVSRFYLNSKGRVNKHVIDNIDLLPSFGMPEVDQMLYMVGITPYQQPAGAIGI